MHVLISFLSSNVICWEKLFKNLTVAVVSQSIPNCSAKNQKIVSIIFFGATSCFEFKEQILSFFRNPKNESKIRF